MRRGNKPEFLLEANELVGINLSWDFTAEHEWGIDGIRHAFGMKDAKNGIIGLGSALGVDARKVNILPNNVIYKEYDDKKKTTVLFFNHFDSQIEIHPELTLFKEDTLACAWDEGSFGIHTIGDTNRGYLKSIYESITKKDIVIFLGGRTGPFSNAGLTICIASKLPEEVKKMWYDTDVDYINLTKAAEKTGITKYLKKKGMQWFALSPKWKDDTKKEVIFWLNPYHQDRDNCGWFTVEQLKEWAEGKGKVTKQQEVSVNG